MHGAVAEKVDILFRQALLASPEDERRDEHREKLVHKDVHFECVQPAKFAQDTRRVHLPLAPSRGAVVGIVDHCVERRLGIAHRMLVRDHAPERCERRTTHAEEKEHIAPRHNVKVHHHVGLDHRTEQKYRDKRARDERAKARYTHDTRAWKLVEIGTRACVALMQPLLEEVGELVVLAEPPAGQEGILPRSERRGVAVVLFKVPKEGVHEKVHDQERREHRIHQGHEQKAAAHTALAQDRTSRCSQHGAAPRVGAAETAPRRQTQGPAGKSADSILARVKAAETARRVRCGRVRCGPGAAARRRECRGPRARSKSFPGA